MEEKFDIGNGITITEEGITDIVSTALEVGIYYWCEKVEVKGELLGEYESDQICKGGTLILYDIDSKKHELTREKLFKGIVMYIESPDSAYGIVEDNEIDTWNVDALVADMIIQFAIFEEIIYG